MKQNYATQISENLKHRGLVIFHEPDKDATQLHLYSCSANPAYPGEVVATITYNGQGATLEEKPRMKEMETEDTVRTEVLRPLQALVDETKGDYSDDRFERIRKISSDTISVWRKYDPVLEARLNT
jgi:hypothetical protein